MSTEEKKATDLQQTQKKPDPPQANASERFTSMVLKEFGETVSGGPQVSEYQKRLIQGYFIAIDRCLQMQEENRIRKNAANSDHKYDNELPIIWQNVNLRDLALDVVHYARMGLDMMAKNHLSPIPFKNNKSGQYNITLMPGYSGIEYIARKYALTPPKSVTVELVHETDTFVPVKKSIKNPVEGYEFTINNPFSRGSVVGGFGYIEYENPAENRLVIMTLEDILKRKPEYASPEFWGGTKKVRENGKLVEKSIEGWFEEMCEKTIRREVFGDKNIPRDPKKIDDDYQHMKLREANLAEMEARAEIDAGANSQTIIIDGATGEIRDDPTPVQNASGEIPPGSIQGEDDLP